VVVVVLAAAQMTFTIHMLASCALSKLVYNNLLVVLLVRSFKGTPFVKKREPPPRTNFNKFALLASIGGVPLCTIKIYLKSSRCIMVKTTERHGEAPLKYDLFSGYDL